MLTNSPQAFTTLVRLRKERILAAKELCSIYYQIQVSSFSKYRIWLPWEAHNWRTGREMDFLQQESCGRGG